MKKSIEITSRNFKSQTKSGLNQMAAGAAVIGLCIDYAVQELQRTKSPLHLNTLHALFEANDTLSARAKKEKIARLESYVGQYTGFAWVETKKGDGMTFAKAVDVEIAKPKHTWDEAIEAEAEAKAAKRKEKANKPVDVLARTKSTINSLFAEGTKYEQGDVFAQFAKGEYNKLLVTLTNKALSLEKVSKKA